MSGPANKECYVTRFWRYVAQTTPSECWAWIGCRNADGYGLLNVHYRNNLAHRLAYEINVGPIPDAMQVLHTCDNPPCVNPAHLWIGTQRDNLADMAGKGRSSGGSQPGELNPSAKLTNAEATAIRDAFRNGATTRELANRYGMSMCQIQHIRKGRTWKQLIGAGGPTDD